MKKAKAVSTEALAHFDAFWERYPKKVKKSFARAKYLKILEEGVDPKEILEGLNNARKEWAMDGNPQFIPHPSSWLNQRRWEDDYVIDPTLEAEAPPPAPPKPKAEPVALFSEDEEKFLKEYGKRPRGAEEVAAFHRAYAEALADLKDAYLLANCAKVAVTDMREDEGNTNKLRRPHYWLEDRAYRDTLDRAKCMPRVHDLSYYKQDDILATIIQEDE